MREEDVVGTRKALDRIYKPKKEDVKILHEIEKWRDGLIAGEEGLLNEITAIFKPADQECEERK